MVSFDEFKKLEIKVARIIEVNDHPNADKLYVLKIDLGSEKRQIVAGIKSNYNPQDLLSRQIAVVANLEPATIRGIESQAMLLAAQDSKGISILQPDREMEQGSPIK